jgi:D-alanyl-D-alanine carboxypeptidase (penicillin-binding protein 5/6)
MKSKKILSLILLLCLLFTLCAPLALAEEPAPSEEPEAETETPAATPAPGEPLEPPALNFDNDGQYQSVILVDLDSGTTLYQVNYMMPRRPASLTKVMTILLALEAVERGEVTMDTIITAGLDCQNGMGDDSSSVYIVAGEQMTLRDLLYCAAVSSGNDACNVIASYLGNGIPGFVERMNQRAAELGCTQTRFVDPNGLSNDNYTCAYDLYLITREAMRHPDFMEICDAHAYTVPATNLNPARELKNSNALISPDGIYGPGYLYEGAHGVKTGYTRAAGYCLISTAEKDDMHLLAIVMGCDGPYLSDTETRYNFVNSAILYDWAFSNFTSRTIVSTDVVLDYLDVALAEGDARVGLKPVNSVTLTLPNNVEPGQEDVRIVPYDEKLTAPIEAGQVLGEAQIYYNGGVFATVQLVSANSVDLNRWEYFKQQIREFLSRPAVIIVLILIVLLIVAYLALVTRYRRLRRKHLKQRKLAEQRRKELAEQRREEAEKAEEGKPFGEDLY